VKTKNRAEQSTESNSAVSNDDLLKPMFVTDEQAASSPDSQPTSFICTGEGAADRHSCSTAPEFATRLTA
jgi:hypothetical protein